MKTEWEGKAANKTCAITQIASWSASSWRNSEQRYEAHVSELSCPRREGAGVVIP